MAQHVVIYILTPTCAFQTRQSCTFDDDLYVEDPYPSRTRVLVYYTTYFVIVIITAIIAAFYRRSEIRKLGRLFSSRAKPPE